MLSRKILKLHVKYFIRNYARPKVILDEAVMSSISNEEYKPRKHPGTTKIKTSVVPDTYVKAIINTLEDYPVKAILADGSKLQRHLRGRVPPMEQDELKETVGKIRVNVMRKFNDKIISNESEAISFKQMLKDRMTNVLREKVYNWIPVNYNRYNSLVYLLCRAAPEYAVLVKIFSDIAARDPTFKPRSLFDFGSGVGTGTWAVNTFWKQHIFEYFNVDASPDMNDLSEMLLKGGTGVGVMSLKGVFYRQFLPATNTTYDLVLSAYSMLELPSLKSRLETVINLWNKTQKYLIVVEQGTNAGFKVVNEIRDFILQIDQDANIGHVFSPCPHDSVCPRFLADDGTPCNTQVVYHTLPVGANSERKLETFSYVVLKKGKRDSNDLGWPRIVREPLVRSKHTICRLCTNRGALQEVIFTAKKHGKITYYCARSSKWGDLLPVKIEGNEDSNQNNVSESTEDLLREENGPKV